MPFVMLVVIIKHKLNKTKQKITKNNIPLSFGLLIIKQNYNHH